MPLIRIDVPDTFPEERWQEAVEVVYDALVNELGAPADDRFAVVTSHPPEGLQVDPSYLGIARGPGAVIVQVTLNAGRVPAVKRAFYAAVATGMESRVGVDRSDVVINLVEVAPENWSFGDGIAQYAPG